MHIFIQIKIYIPNVHVGTHSKIPTPKPVTEFHLQNVKIHWAPEQVFERHKVKYNTLPTRAVKKNSQAKKRAETRTSFSGWVFYKSRPAVLIKTSPQLPSFLALKICVNLSFCGMNMCVNTSQWNTTNEWIT